MNCMTCLDTLRISVVVPEDDDFLGADRNGRPSRAPHDNAFCSECGTQVPVAHARLILAAQR